MYHFVHIRALMTASIWVSPQFHLLLDHFVLSYSLTIAWTSAAQVQPEMHLLVQPQVHLFVHLYIDLEMHLQVQFQCIIRCTLLLHTFIVVPFALPNISPDVLKSALFLSFFNWQDFASIFTFKAIFESILKCIPYTFSFAISFASFGIAICDFVV